MLGSNLSNLPIIPVLESDFDPENLLESFPEDFECPLCMLIRSEMLECRHCSQTCCRECLTSFSKVGNKNIPNGKFECTVCHKVDVFNKQNKILNDILMNLRFQCPLKCKQIYPFSELQSHVQRGLCYQGYVRPNSKDRGAPKMGGSVYIPTQGSGAGNQMRQSVVNQRPLFDLSGFKDNRPPIQIIHFLQKDSKNVYQLDIRNKTVQTIKVQPYNNSSFPHNFQCVQNPFTQQLFLVGGGDYQSDNDTLYSLYEIQVNNHYQFIKRDSMKHPRHGHSACWFGEKFIVVTGSRKEKNSSQTKCEMYNSDIDLWFEMPDLNIGRHYHSSCAFRDTSIYVFCGIANSTRKYINTIERYDQSNKNKWTQIEVNNKMFPERQGCGTVQLDGQYILIFGGFSGKFLGDCYYFDCMSNELSRAPATPNDMFLFQMPVCFDPTSQSIYACDMQRHQVYKFSRQPNQWTIHQSMRAQQGR